MGRAAPVNQASSLCLANCHSLSYEGGSPAIAIGIPARLFEGIITRVFVFTLQIDSNCFRNLTFICFDCLGAF